MLAIRANGRRHPRHIESDRPRAARRVRQHDARRRRTRRHGGEPAELRVQARSRPPKRTWCSTCDACPIRISWTACAISRVATPRSCASCGGTRSTQDFIDRLTAFLTFALPHYVTEGKSYLTVAIGCTGGRHRSVMIAEALKTIAGGTSQASGCASSIGMDENERSRSALMIGVVVVTHGQLATELVNAAETIVGDMPRVCRGVDRLARGHRGRSPGDRAGGRPGGEGRRAC